MKLGFWWSWGGFGAKDLTEEEETSSRRDLVGDGDLEVRRRPRSDPPEKLFCIPGIQRGSGPFLIFQLFFNHILMIVFIHFVEFNENLIQFKNCVHQTLFDT